MSRILTLFDWAFTDRFGRQSYARTPENADALTRSGVSLTPVYTVEDDGRSPKISYHLEYYNEHTEGVWKGLQWRRAAPATLAEAEAMMAERAIGWVTGTKFRIVRNTAEVVGSERVS